MSKNGTVALSNKKICWKEEQHAKMGMKQLLLFFADFSSGDNCLFCQSLRTIKTRATSLGLK